MTQRTRLVILLICIVLFFLLAPYLVLYSLGYRVDFVHWEITATGGIYIKAEPAATTVTINEKPTTSRGIFADYVFIQNLIPGNHSVSITKEGYHDYHKTLLVAENEVTKLENVILFKNDIAFSLTQDPEQFTLLTEKAADQFMLKTGSLYYANTPENASLPATQKATPVIKNVVAFEASRSSVLWLGTDGVLYNFSLSTKTSEQLSAIALKVNKAKIYTLKTLAGNTFLLENTTAWLFDQNTKMFTPFHEGVIDLAASPDNQKIAYWNAKELWYWLPKAVVAESAAAKGFGETKQKILLQKSPTTISSVQWINSDYVVFLAGSNITISEIDARGNVNAVTLPNTITASDETITLKNPKIYFNPEDQKLYILQQETLFVSERLLP